MKSSLYTEEPRKRERGHGPPTFFSRQLFLYTGHIPCLGMFHLPVEVSTYFWATYRQVFSTAVILRIKLYVYDDRVIEKKCYLVFYFFYDERQFTHLQRHIHPSLLQITTCASYTDPRSYFWRARRRNTNNRIQKMALPAPKLFVHK